MLETVIEVLWNGQALAGALAAGIPLAAVAFGLGRRSGLRAPIGAGGRIVGFSRSCRRRAWR